MEITKETKESAKLPISREVIRTIIDRTLVNDDLMDVEKSDLLNYFSYILKRDEIKEFKKELQDLISELD